jgi:dTMP kinase
MGKIKGKLIVFEGLDGSGKTTQVKILFKKLKKLGYKAVIYDFPQYSNFFGKLIDKYLSGEFGEINKANPYFISLLYAFDRWQIKEELKKDLKDKIVIADRYSTSNFIYQGAKIKNKKEKEKFFKWLENLEFKILGLPIPDLVLYLKVPYKISQKLIKNRKKDLHERSISYLKKVEKNSSYLIKKYNWKVIKSVKKNRILPKKEIAEKIWQIVKNYI